MKLLHTLNIILLVFTPITILADGGKREVNFIKPEGLSLFDAIQNIQSKFKFKINIKGALPQLIIHDDFTHNTIKDAIISLLKESGIHNYIISINNNDKIATISLLNQKHYNNLKALNNTQYAQETENIQKIDLEHLDGIIEIEKEANISNKPFTYEEIEALKEEQKKLEQNEKGLDAFFSQEEYEQLRKDTEKANKENNLSNEAIPDFHLEQLKNNNPYQEEQLTQDELNLLNK